MADHSIPLIHRADWVRIGGDPKHLIRGVKVGSLVRIRRGVFVDAERWASWRPSERHEALIESFRNDFSRSLVLSHESAAVWWGIPLIFGVPNAVHVSVPSLDERRSTAAQVRHRMSLAPREVVTHRGIFATSIVRTTVDLMATLPFSAAVAVADHTVKNHPGVSADILIEAIRPGRGSARARTVGEFCSPRADSPGESYARAQFETLGCEPPTLQQEFSDRQGRMFVDFYWERLKLVCEFDGRVKYLDAHMRAGKTAEQIVIEEKLREDRLRALGLRVIRLDWSTLHNLELLGSLLRTAGVRTAHHR